jgi:hypothetical protein
VAVRALIVLGRLRRSSKRTNKIRRTERTPKRKEQRLSLTKVRRKESWLRKFKSGAVESLPERSWLECVRMRWYSWACREPLKLRKRSRMTPSK